MGHPEQHQSLVNPEPKNKQAVYTHSLELPFKPHKQMGKLIGISMAVICVILMPSRSQS